MRFKLIIPTRDSGDKWLTTIQSIKEQSIVPDEVLVVDSASSDSTVNQALTAGFHVEVIDADSFDHGGTRRLAAEMAPKSDFVVFMTQDAILTNPDSFRRILEPFQDVRVSAVCGRQLPRKGSTMIEAHARIYNYPVHSYCRSISDVSRYGLKIAFISNSFAAYRVAALEKVGGFPAKVIFGEDMYVAAKMLKAGDKIAYAAEACVYHSHAYTFWQEMKRYFDMGVLHAREPWIRKELGGAEGEGIKFVISEINYLKENAFWRIPEGLLRTLVRYTGFRLGLIEQLLPLWFKRGMAMNRGYFSRD